MEKTKLYKYISCSGEECKKRALRSIENYQIYLSDGSNFNDPFDLLVQDNERINTLHILCLTNSHQNSLMWAHYADSHKGMCLTIEVPVSLTYPVCYSGKRVLKNDVKHIDSIISKSKKSCKKNLQKEYCDLTIEKKAALIKSRKWFYEKEYRLLFDNEEGLIVDGDKWYLSAKITNVYLGVNFNIEENKEIIAQCQKKGIPIKRMALSDTNYSLQPKNYKE